VVKSNKHIKTVTRDRASAYAKAISEVLPDAMQIADRFHLHQNLLEAITKALGREILATIAIPKEEILDKTPEEGVAKNQGQAGQESHDENSKDAVVISFDENPEESKKMPKAVDNLTESEEKRGKLIEQIQQECSCIYKKAV